MRDRDDWEFQCLKCKKGFVFKIKEGEAKVVRCQCGCKKVKDLD